MMRYSVGVSPEFAALTRMVFPRTLGLEPKRSCQRALLIMMTCSPPGRKSSAANTRPSTARTPMASREPGAHSQRRNFLRIVVGVEDEAAQTRVIRDLDHVGEGLPVHAFQAAGLRLARRVVERAVEPLRVREWHRTNHVAVHDRERRCRERHPQRKRNHGRGESRIAPQRTRGKPEIADQTW